MLSVFESTCVVLRKILGPKEDVVTKGRRTLLKRSFMICTTRQIFFVLSKQG